MSMHRMTPLEMYMVRDDSPRYPMSFFVELNFVGHILKKPFLHAVSHALYQHPMLRSLLVKQQGRLVGWQVLEQNDAPSVDWDSLDGPLEFPSAEFFDLTQESGLRTWVREGPRNAKVVLQFHHACCDGFGAFQFLCSLLQGYAMYCPDADQSHSPTIPCSILDRGRLSLIENCQTQSWKVRRAATAHVVRNFILQRPSELVHHVTRAKPPEVRTLPKVFRSELDKDTYHALRAAANRLDVSLNSLLVRDLFLTLSEWNRARGKGRKRDWLRVVVPTNLRRRSERRYSACHMTGYVFLNRRISDCKDCFALLDSINRDTRLERQRQDGVIFAQSLEWCYRFYLPIELLASEQCTATTVFSNMGDLFRAFSRQFPEQDGMIETGNLLLSSIWGVPPLRDKTSAVFSSIVFSERLGIAMRTDAHWTDSESEELLTSFISRLQNYSRYLEVTSTVSSPVTEHKLAEGS